MPLKRKIKAIRVEAPEAAKAPRTTRSTAGPGYDFEDQVGAWILLKALLDQPVIKGFTSARLLQAQTAALGWLFDDLLLTDDTGRHIAISCKDNLQVSSNGLPKDFLDRAWQQWLGIAGGIMDRDRDHLMLVTRGRHPVFHAVWSDIKSWCTGDVSLALERIREPAKHRRIYESIEKRIRTASPLTADEEILMVVRRLEVMHVDFDLRNSESLRTAISDCRRLLADGDAEEGERLWKELLDKAKASRLGDGTINLADLRRELRPKFFLKDWPDYGPSLSRLMALTTDYKRDIETVLPSGFAVVRQRFLEKVRRAANTERLFVVYGESGTGKSALMKTALEAFPENRQVWLGPDELKMALNEHERGQLGLRYPLVEILDASVSPSNTLVIDSCERLNPATIGRASNLVADLMSRNVSAAEPAWRVIIIGQTEAWSRGTLQRIANSPRPPHLEVEPVERGEVRAALCATHELAWLASDDEATGCLTNLRTLAYVIEAGAHFQGGGPVSLTTVADRLWNFWTDKRVALQSLLMRLGEREARFEPSTAISELDPAEAAAIDSAPAQFPVRQKSNRIQFQHDLAGDWARFQRLKEIVHETDKWASYSGNPLWHNSLRMLGELLLREPNGSLTSWDIAFQKAKATGESTPLTADLLLDALYLDSNADAFLDERAAMLFANGGATLLRLLRRFEHVATAPGIPEFLQNQDDLRIYFEEHYRIPIVGRWPPIARFLAKHRQDVAALLSPRVASVCERWLTTTPPLLAENVPIPFRREFAEVALATARALQIELGKGVIFLGDAKGPIYRATLAGAVDLPDEVSAWALEMARRRPQRADVSEQIALERRQKAEEHKRRMQTDREYRARHTRSRSESFFLGGGRKLPPWPRGPQGRVENDFRKVCLHSFALQGMMAVRPSEAAELLLALIIEDAPEEPYGRRDLLDEGLELVYDDSAYPTAFWKSPFYSFLRLNPTIALGAIIELVNFCTERWADERAKEAGKHPPAITITFGDGTARKFIGNYRVYTWLYVSSRKTGQLHCALAALERWLCDLLDQGTDVSDVVKKLAQNCKSVAVLGVLVSVGKYRPALFSGFLKPLLRMQWLYVWDEGWVKNSANNFDGYSWSRQGELVFRMAREWFFAKHRSVPLEEICSRLIVEDRNIGDFVLSALTQWKMPSDSKLALETKLLMARLNYRYHNESASGESGNSIATFSYPQELLQEVRAFQASKAPVLSVLMLPEYSRKALSSNAPLREEQAAAFAMVFGSIDAPENAELGDDFKAQARLGAAAVLLSKASEWLNGRPDLQEKLRQVIADALTSIGDTAEQLRKRFYAPWGRLEFLAYAVAYEWAGSESPSAELDENLLRVLTSGDQVAAAVLVNIAYEHRARLGPRWWRLLYLTQLWSGLSVLTPGPMAEALPAAHWSRWLRWLRTRRFDAAGPDSIDPLALARRVERHERDRWRRVCAKEGRRFDDKENRRYSGGLDIHFLDATFSWLFGPNAVIVADPAEALQNKRLVASFWRYEAWCRSGSADEDDDCKPSSELGYSILGMMARLVLAEPLSSTPELWLPILSLGPRAHYSIEGFIQRWFYQVSETTDLKAFGLRWRQMIEYGLGADWDSGRSWYHGARMLRLLLGFGASVFMTRNPAYPDVIRSLVDLYETWAKKRLHNEDDLGEFCGFLGTELGKPLRLVGLQWMVNSIESQNRDARWYREATCNNLIAFLDVLTAEHWEEIIGSTATRDALLALLAKLVVRQVVGALALQERVRTLLQGKVRF